MLKISKIGCLLAMTVLSATTTVTFPSRAALVEALAPLQMSDVVDRIPGIQFAFDETIENEKKIPFRNPGVGNLLKTAVYQGKNWTVFYPETPRVPHHLMIGLNRNGVRGIADINDEENWELFSTIKKAAEIYKTVSVDGFVIAQYDTPQEGHLGRYVVELIPHLPQFSKVKNIADKVDSNRHVLFRKANLSVPVYKMSALERENQVQEWQTAFQKEWPPLEESKITFPFTREESHLEEANTLLKHQLLEMLSDRGAKISEESSLDPLLPTDFPQKVTTATANKCFFCDESIAQHQTVYMRNNATIFYNIRKGVRPAANFLILPKRHTEKVYGLNSEEINDIAALRRALVEVMKEMHPDWQVVVYTQDHPSVGQTVFHSHEQLVAIDPKTISLTWTIQSLLYPNGGNVSKEEMDQVKKEIGLKLDEKFGAIEKAASQ